MHSQIPAIFAIHTFSIRIVIKFQNSIQLCLLLSLYYSCGTDKTLLQASSNSDPRTLRLEKIQNVLKSQIPVLRLEIPETETERRNAQELVLKDKRMLEFYREKSSGRAMLSEVFSVSPLRPSDQFEKASVCTDKSCFRVEIYHYSSNSTIQVLVHLKENKILELNYLRGFQPEIPPHLADLAVWIASNDSVVIRHYEGKKPNGSDSRMASTKTALNRTKCQRSQHLCLAPTFVKDDKALWVIVDLTELKVAGIKWTDLGYTGQAITERLVQNEKMMECYCEVELKHQQDDWSFHYTLTRSDGLRLRHVRFRQHELFDDVKMVDWHVSYSGTEGFGYSDAIGCPEYSQAAVIAVEPPFFEWNIQGADTLGFVLVQKYYSEGWPTPCSYNYQQQFEFFRDGSFRPVVGSLGRGCGNDGTYRPVTRIALSGNGNRFEKYENDGWKSWTREQWFLEDDLSAYESGKFIARIVNSSGAQLKIEAARGQFGDSGRGDKAYFYITKRHRDRNEGDGDLPTIGPCCNTDYRQGPEKFIEPSPEALDRAELVLWYVPQLKNDNRPGQEYCWAESVLENGVYVPRVYPCFSGAKFHWISHE